MAIVAKRRNYQAVQQSKPNLARLLLPSEFHPHGRVQIDPTTGMVRTPGRNILYTTKIRRRGQDIQVEVNGGHAKAAGSVWRIALGGPARYFWKLFRDELMYKLRGKPVISAPMLTDEETVEARQFVAYLLVTKDKEQVLPVNFLKTTTGREYDNGITKRNEFEEINKGFYQWLKKQDDIPDLPKITDAFVFLPA